MRPLRWLSGLGVGLGSLMAFAGSIVLHVGTAPGRRLVTNVANESLASTFKGRILVDRIDTLFLPAGHIAFAARILDPQGEEVVRVDRASGRFGIAPLVTSLASKGPMHIRIVDIDIESGRLGVLKSKDGGITLADAFAPQTPSPPDPNSKGVIVDVAPIHARKLHVQGDVVENLDVDVRDLGAEFHMTPASMEIALSGFDGDVSLLELKAATVSAKAKAVLPSDPKAAPQLDADIKIVSGATNVAMAVKMADSVDAHVTAHADPSIAHSLALGVEPTAPVDLDLRAQGPRNDIAIRAGVKAGQGAIDMDGKADAVNERVKVAVRIHDFDARAVQGSAPPTRIDGSIDADADGKAGTAMARVEIAPSKVAGQSTPDLVAYLAVDPNKLRVRAKASEPGTNVDVEATLALVGDKIVTAKIDASSRDLARLRAVAPEARGSASVDASGTVNLTSNAVNATAHVRANGFAWGDLAYAQSADIDAKVGGTLQAPHIDTTVHGTGVKVASIAGDRVDAGGHLSFGSFDLDQGFVEIQRGDTVIRTDVDHLTVGTGIRASGVHVTGLGGPIDADFSSVGSKMSIAAHGKGVRFEPLAAIGAIPNDLTGGGDLDVDLTLDPSGVRGHANVDVKGVQDHKETLRGRIALIGNGQVIDVESHVLVDPIGRVDIPRSQVHISGDPKKPSTWTNASGIVTAETELDLAALRDRLAAMPNLHEALADVHALGTAHARLRFERAKPGGPVATTADVDTHGLSVTAPSMTLHGTELHVHGKLDDDEVTAEVGATDAQGELFTLRSAVALRENKKKISNMNKAPMHASFIIPARTLDPIDFGESLQGKTAHVAAAFEAAGTLENPKFSGWMRSTVEGYGSARIDSLDGEWDRAHEAMPHGALVARARVDLETAAQRLRKIQSIAASIPQTLAGVVDFDLVGRREPGEALPSGRVSAHSYGLKVGSEHSAIAGVDVRASASLHSPTGELGASMTAWDKDGAVAVFDAKALLPKALTPSSLQSLQTNWNTVPVNARFTVPPHSIAQMASMVADTNPDTAKTVAQSRKIEGGVAMEATFEGSAEKPKVVVRGYGLGLRQTTRQRKRGSGGVVDADAGNPPVDASIYATYNGQRADLGMTVIDQGHATMRGAFTALVDSSAMLKGKSAPIQASGDLQLRKFRTDPLPIVGASVKGAFDADVMLRDYGKDARLAVTLKGDNIAADNVKFTHSEVRADVENGKLSAAVGLAQAQGGWAGVMLTSDVKWGAASAPSLDNKGPLRLDYRVDKFQLAGLRPLVKDAVPELEGQVDGRGRVLQEHGTQTADGTLSLRNTNAYVNALGQNVQDAQFDLKLGAGNFIVENGKAKVDQGEVLFAASGRLQGLVPNAIRADVRFPKKKEFPIYVGGVRYGDVSGQTMVNVAITDKAVNVDVDVPNLNVALADLDPRSLQNLDPADKVKIGMKEPDGKFQVIKLQRLQKGEAAKANQPPAGANSSSTDVHVHLKNVVLTQGTMLFIPLNGELEAIMKDQLRMKGRITLVPNGQLNLKGRKFRVVNGTITWTEADEVSNPVVIAEAQWEAPDKTNVIADFVGPAASGKLSLRSEPSHSNSEILSLLLFGTADGKSQGGSSSATATAASGAAGVLSGGIGEALSKVTDVEVEATIESPDAQTTRPEVSARVSNNVTLEVGYNIAPPTVKRDTILVSADVRLTQRWSFQLTEGDRQTTILDLLWQYRY